MDCFNGEILSLCMRDNMRKELYVDAVRAMANRRAWLDTLQRSRQPVYQQSDPLGVCPVGRDAEPERRRSLLRQCPDVELLYDAEEGTDLSDIHVPSEHRGSQVSGIPICFRLLQPESSL